METLRQSLQGIVPPLVTPLLQEAAVENANGGEAFLNKVLTIDVDGTRKLIEHVISGGVSAVFAFGSTGEGPSLPRHLRHEFVKLVCETVCGRVPVLVGIIGTCMEDIIQDAKEYQRIGASALVITAPYYFPVTQEELIHWCWQVYHQVDPMPLVLYNMPGLTKVWFEIGTVEKLLWEDSTRSIPRLIAIKDSSADLDYFKRLCGIKNKYPNLAVLMGPEHLTLKAMELGADGIVPGGSNVNPNLFVELHHACVRLRDSVHGNSDKILDEGVVVNQLARRLDVFQAIYGAGVNWIVATKIACEVKGLCSGSLAPPFGGGDYAQEKENIRTALDKVEAMPSEG